MTEVTASQQLEAPPSLDTVSTAVFRASGAVAVVTGTLVVALGSRSIPGGGRVAASADSVLRFYAVWWAAAGVLLWRAPTRPVSASGPVLLAVTFLGGLARVISAIQTGWPHPLFRSLMVAELVLPPLLTLLRRPELVRRPSVLRSRRHDV